MMDERGDIILDGLLRIVAGLVLTALLLFEAGAVVINHVQVDGSAQSAARAGARAWDTHGDHERAEAAAEEAASKLSGAIVSNVSLDGDAVTVTVTREPPVLLINRIESLQERIEGTATSRVPTGE